VSQVPSDYTPDTDFSTIAATPILTTGLPGAELDAEFSAIAGAVNDTIDRLSEVQRDDGQIRNGMVKLHTLASDVLALFAANGANNRGVWAPESSYESGDFVTVLAPAFTLSGLIDNSAANGNYYQTGTDDNGYAVFGLDGDEDAEWQVRIRPYTGGGGPPYPQNWAVTQTTIVLGAPVINTISIQTTAEFFPWSDPGVSWADSDSGTPAIVQGSADQSLANASYIAVAAHVSGSVFSDDIRYWGLIAAPPSAGNLVIDQFTGDGSDTTFVLSTAPLSEANTQVYVNGVYIPKTSYSLTGSTITFSVAPANTAVIEVVSGITVEVQTAVVADNSVTEDKIADGAVTEGKLADGSVTAAKLASGAAVPDDSISAAKLESNAVTTDKIAAGSVTEGKIASGAVSEDKLATGAVSATKLATSAVTTAKITDSGVTAAKLGTSAVETAKINDSAVTTAKIADGNVTNAKVADATLTAAKLVSGTLDSTLDARPGVAKVVCRFTLSSSPAQVGNDVNVATITNPGTGVFRVTFTTALASANYVPQVSIVSSAGRTATIEASSDITTTYVDITVRNSAGSVNNGLNTEAVCLTIDAP
jgi:hypothetical protein